MRRSAPWKKRGADVVPADAETEIMSTESSKSEYPHICVDLYRDKKMWSRSCVCRLVDQLCRRVDQLWTIVRKGGAEVVSAELHHVEGNNAS